MQSNIYISGTSVLWPSEQITFRATLRLVKKNDKHSVFICRFDTGVLLPTTNPSMFALDYKPHPQWRCEVGRLIKEAAVAIGLQRGFFSGWRVASQRRHVGTD